MDIWRLGKHRLICGDSTEKATIKKLMDGDEADLLLTDPPYNVNYQGKSKSRCVMQNDKMKEAEYREFLTAAFTNAYEAMKNGAPFYVWHSTKEHLNFETALNNAGLKVRQQLIWAKNQMVLGWSDYHYKHEPCLYGWKAGAAHKWYGGRKQTTLLNYNKPLKNDLHPTMKPVEMIAYQITNSTKENEIVLDLFGGSGTTLIASEQTGRVCRMAEIDEGYCDVIIKRWENLTGQKAERIVS